MGVAEDGTTVLIIHNWRGSYIGDNEHGQLYYVTEIKRA